MIENTNLIVYDKSIETKVTFMHRYLLLLLSIFTFQASSVAYTYNEINSMIHTEVNEDSAKEFVRGFFVAKDPKGYIESYTLIHKNRIEPVYLEYKFYFLLSEISHHSKQPYLQEFITKMKNMLQDDFDLKDKYRAFINKYKK